jgi:hypothetical protein
MKRVWAAAALAPLSFAASAHAQTTTPGTITGQTTTPIATATVNNGAPADISIQAGGSVEPKTGGTAGAPLAAVTLNSSNNVTNAGTIQFNAIDHTIGILGLGGNTGSITNSGTIQLSETVNQKINSKNGIAEGPFASGTDRVGISVTGSSPLIGTLTNSGVITVIGENSGGIFIGAGGLTGSLADPGTITVTGDNSFGIHAVGQISGDVTVGAQISATGQNATGLALDGGVGGKLDISNAITVTGFHSLTAPITVNQIKALDPTQLEAGGPAISVGGSVGAGISIDAPVAAVAAVAATSTTPAVAAVAASPGGAITASGSTALQIGGAGPITIGAGSSGASLLIGGAVTSSGVYRNFDATAIQIGTTGGGAVTMPGGIDITGSVSASTVADNLTSTSGSGAATALHLMSGVNVGSITNTGVLAASSTSTVANTVTAIQIDAGAVGGVHLTNSGTISASIGGFGAVLGGPPAAGGTLGTVTAIQDNAGAISTITNTGQILTAITPVVSNQTETGSTYALDLRGNTTGVTITQSQAPTIPATSSTSATTPAAPAITGDVLFGSGAAALNLQAGTLTGAVAFGSSGANTLDIEGGAVMTGALTEAAGGGLGVTVGNGRLDMTTASHVGLTGLNVGSAGEVSFTVDPLNGQAGQFAVTGSASLASGAKIGINLLSITATPQTYNLITTTGTLTSGATDQSLLGPTPFIIDAAINTTTGAGGSVAVTISPKTALELGLNSAETAAYGAVFSQFSLDPGVAADLLGKLNRSDFIHIYDQFLPDYSGGVFDSLVSGQAQIAQAQADTPLKLQTDETHGWVQEIGYLADRQDTSAANGYKSSGFGFIGGLEQARGDSAVGITAAFVTSGVKNDRQGPGGLLSTAGVEVGAYWREGDPKDGLAMHASVNGGYLFISNHRLLFDETSSGTVGLFREAKSQWNGLTASGELGASYQVPIGRFYVRPEVIADYVYLYEGAFNERGGGVSEDLAVASRNSSEASVTGDLVFGADLGGVNHWRPEMTIGWRQVVSGGPGDTTARFISGGPSFTLSPKFDDKGSLITRVGVRAGGQYADFSADAGGQLNNTYQVYNARAVARFLF